MCFINWLIELTRNNLKLSVYVTWPINVKYFPVKFHAPFSKEEETLSKKCVWLIDWLINSRMISQSLKPKTLQPLGLLYSWSCCWLRWTGSLPWWGLAASSPNHSLKMPLESLLLPEGCISNALVLRTPVLHGWQFPPPHCIVCIWVRLFRCPFDAYVSSRGSDRLLVPSLVWSDIFLGSECRKSLFWTVFQPSVYCVFVLGHCSSMPDVFLASTLPASRVLRFWGYRSQVPTPI